jgi:hypothetical protein
VSLLRKRAARRLRVLYGATKPLPHPGGHYHVEMTYEEQMNDFDSARRRRLDADPHQIERRAAHAASRAVLGSLGRGK